MYQTISEIAERFRVSPDTVYSWIERDLLPGVVRIGGTIRVDRMQLDAFVNTGGQPGRRVRRPKAQSEPVAV